MSIKTDLAQKKRVENYIGIRNEMLANGYIETVETISILKANIMALVTALPIAVVFYVLYRMKWRGYSLFGMWDIVAFIGLSLFFIVLHEFLHGFTWHFFCKKKWESIHFGVMLNSLTPYCNCKEVLSYQSYLLGGLMPFLVIGVFLFYVSYFFGNDLLMLISMINIIGAGGDTTITLMLLKYKKALILDHPTECGFIAFTKQ